jgi:predicted acyl esterase
MGETLGRKASFRSAAKPAVTRIYTGDIPKPDMPGVKLKENIYVKMSDGAKLAVDIYHPKQGGRYPVLLSMSPYMKEIQQCHPGWCHSIEAGATGFWVSHGYIHVIAQARGSGLSQGRWAFLDNREQQDGYELIEWIAGQPWCDGNVGMIGDSYWAWIQYGVAALKPPHLRCIVPHDGGTDLYRDAFYPGGIFNGGEFANHWTVDTVLQCVWPGPVEGKRPPINLAAELAAHPYDGPFYRKRSPWWRAGRIEVPALVCVTLTALHSRSQLAIYPLIKGRKKLLVEPETGYWAHLRFVTDRNLNRYVLRWVDHWMKGKETGILKEPEVAIFDGATRTWRYENEYPLKRTTWTRLYLQGGTRTGPKETSWGAMTPEPPARERPDQYRLPDSTALLLAGKPVLAYSTSPLKKDLRVWGPLSTTLYASSTREETAWFVKLLDVGPKEETKLLSRGVLKASFRQVDRKRSAPGQPFHSFQNPVPLKPKKVYEFQIEMRPIFHTFLTGHRIRLEIASDDLSYFGSLHTLDIQRLPMPVENTLYHDSRYPSHLLLPVIPDAPVTMKVRPHLSRVNWPLVPGNRWPSTRGGRLLV